MRTSLGLALLVTCVALAAGGQEDGVFRRDFPVVWHLAVLRAIVHAASTEIRGGRLPDSEAEAVMLTTAIAAISVHPG